MTTFDVRRLADDSRIPTRGSVRSAGLDLYATRSFFLWPFVPKKVSLNVAFALPEGHVGVIHDRSSLGSRGIHVLGGVIDEDYRGNVSVVLINLTLWPKWIEAKSRIGQLLVLPCYYGLPVAADSLANTSRGTGGFGSTGR